MITAKMKQANLSGVRLIMAGLLLSATTLAGAQAGDSTAPVSTPTAPTPAASSGGSNEQGLAAVYSDRLNGHRTANGQRYDRNKLTAAHKTLPFGTQLKVTNTSNGKSVIVRINDRGPKEADRILDISPRAARALSIRSRGMAKVTTEVITP